ncbi:MAG: MFS transporter, partial [Microthrixaceae bacterium]
MTVIRRSKDSTDETLSAPTPADGAGGPRAGSLGAALRHQPFRRVWLGQLASNIGTWMQNIVLGVLAYDLTGEAWFIGVVTFAQLGPMLLLSPVGGAVADRVNRRVLMITIAVTQTVFSLALAVVTLHDHPNRVAIVGLVFLIGVGGALNGPAAAATLPALVGRRDLQGAVALNSAAMNASRVVGPILGGAVAALGGPSLVFVVNAASFLFVIWAVGTVKADFSPKGRGGEGPVQQLREGVRAARADRILTRVLVTISVFSLCCLVFIYQMPYIAKTRLGIEGLAYTLLFAGFALGAALGALSMGSFFAGVERSRMSRGGLLVFAAALAVFGLTTSPWVAYPAVFMTGAAYFVLVTALSTTMQMRVDDAVRGRVMGLWMMGWAGLVPVGGLIAGPVIDHVGVVPVLVFGAGVALLLGLAVDLREPDLEAVGAA